MTSRQGARDVWPAQSVRGLIESVEWLACRNVRGFGVFSKSEPGLNSKLDPRALQGIDIIEGGQAFGSKCSAACARHFRLIFGDESTLCGALL